MVLRLLPAEMARGYSLDQAEIPCYEKCEQNLVERHQVQFSSIYDLLKTKGTST